MMLRFILIAALLLTAGASLAQSRCTDQTPCQLGERSYHVREPDGWNGTDPLPVLLHFHGWQRQGTLIVRHQRISGATRRRDVLLVAPNGLGRSWNFRSADTSDVPFARAVLEDIKARYPVDASRVFVSGYSWGSNMAWRFVCEDGADIAALLAISGTLPQSTECGAGPAEVRQVYGLADTVLPFPFGADETTGNAVRLWRDKFGCDAGKHVGTWQQVAFLQLDRTVWSECARGRVVLDTHPGGHFIPHGWIARQLDELLGLPLSYP